MTPVQPDAGGIRGDVVLWPAAPVQRVGTDGSRPYPARIQVMDGAGRVVADVKTDAAGRFALPLPPGAYTLHPVSDVAGPRAPAQSVVVERGRFTPVRVTYDSGIR